ncbi:hypothetical protein GCM10010400_76450 [Streptomyces aculeolatus]|uniref:hypothetical protein n=1 Tax=Streptomyces aculeolatus TaxID=270689 RepID=UPI001CEE0596|nr:hypothetical protein [Streptomyces aculeolatus]
MGTTIIAVVGALAGAFGTTALQYVTTTRQQRRQALADAVKALLAAIVGHREHQWLKIAARRDGLRDVEGAREKRYAARSSVTSAMDAVYMATRDSALLAAAQEAIDAAFALGDAPEDEIDAAGERARKAHTALRLAAAKAVA